MQTVSTIEPNFPGLLSRRQCLQGGGVEYRYLPIPVEYLSVPYIYLHAWRHLGTLPNCIPTDKQNDASVPAGTLCLNGQHMLGRRQIYSETPRMLT